MKGEISLSSHKIFLSKSHEATMAISRGVDYGSGVQEARVKGVSCGQVLEDVEFIPAIYHNKGYFYCAIQYITDETQAATYELIIC